MNLRRLLAIAIIEMRRTLRDRTSLSLLLLLPAFQIILFGFAIRIEPHDLPVGVMGRGDRAEAIARMISTDLRLRLVRSTREGDSRAMLQGAATVVIDVAPSGVVRIDADGAEPVSARAALAIVQGDMLQVASNTLPDAVPKIDLHWAFNADQRSAWVLVPGLGGAIVLVAMLLLAAQSIVREREEGEWDALLLSRVNGLELLIGKMLPFLLLAVIQEAIILLLGAWLFELEIGRGSALLMLLVLPFASAHLVWGFVLSLLARTRLQAMQGAMFFYLPSILLSGFLFPFAAMPGWARAIGSALPLTHFVRASRDLLLRDADSHVVWQALPPLLLCCGLGLMVALLLWNRERGS